MVQGVSGAAFTPAILLVITTRVQPSQRLVATSSVIHAGSAAEISAQVTAQLAAALGIGGLSVAFTIGSGLCAPLLTLISTRPSHCETRVGYLPALIEVCHPIPEFLARSRILFLLFAAVSYLTVFVGLYSAIQLAGPSSIVGDPALLLLIRASATPARIAVPALAPFLVQLSGRRRFLTAVALHPRGSGSARSRVCSRYLSLRSTCLSLRLIVPATVTEVMRAAPGSGTAANALYSSAIFGGASLGAPLAASDIRITSPEAGFGTFAITSAALILAAWVLETCATRPRPNAVSWRTTALDSRSPLEASCPDR